MAQAWSISYGTGTYGNPELSMEARHKAALQTRLNELADTDGDFNIGAKSGDKVTVRIYGEISDDATTALNEFQKIPFGKAPIYEVTAQIYRRGFAVATTEVLEDLDRLDINSSTIHTLTKHMARTHNSVINTRLTAGRSHTYVALTASTYEFLSTGGVSSAAAAKFSYFHLQKLTLEMIRKNIPYFDGENYVAVVSPTVESDLHLDQAANGFVDIMKYTSGSKAEGLFRGEIGKAGRFRFIMDNHAVSDQIGTSNLYGSGFFCGYEAVKEVMGPYQAHFRVNNNLGGDFGFQSGVCWTSFQDWKVVWNHTTHGQGSVVHYTST